ncbi:ATP-dependent helicase [Pseudoalteromonas luteoviolacea]|uniref:ATP-dependent helicase n=1 Tax=Pseudoalteromonas luteoviolacea TaxID=43657 RepID=UPI001F1A1A6C|nr:ATP-dependent helicase [Pseudoalteromonas luteoviolacea]MCF6440459.1 ATP-dependent helicase [Pseudoalteromonas luteoviolacea]
MDQPLSTPLDKIKKCIESEQSFVLQGGAGSGKTETLKRAVNYCTERFPNKKIVCITHTNKAVDEIIDRVGTGVEVSTIHSFVGGLVKPYKRNLLKYLPELFCLPLFEELCIEHYGGDDKVRKTEEHNRYKALHETWASRRLIVLQESTEKVTGKREYDKAPSSFNAALNAGIEELNDVVRESFRHHHFKDVAYNDTPFDSFNNATFGHDGLIKIAALLFSNYSNIGKIVRDKYDCIFIDEYQDTDEKIIDSLINFTPEHGLTIGLFGDSEQAIYDDGIGSAIRFIDDGRLKLIEKEDNYRCSPQVIDVANKFRSDGLVQKVGLKEVNGKLEEPEEREGEATFYYSIKPLPPEKPVSPKKRDSDDLKSAYKIAKAKYDVKLKEYKLDLSRRLENLTAFAQADIGEHVLLKLPNKSIARDANFGNLYDLFDGRFRDTREEIRKQLDRLQFGQLTEILQLFDRSSNDNRSYNKLIGLLKKQGFVIKNKQDKRELYSMLEEFSVSDEAAYVVMEHAIKAGLISLSDSHKSFLIRRDRELERFAEDTSFDAFKKLLDHGCNTKKRMCDYLAENDDIDLASVVVEEKYEQLKKDVQSEAFFMGLFGKNIKFKEVMAFFKYENDDSNFMTMHKTKGTGIENVIVVLDEFNWNKYDFGSCFRAEDDNPSRQALTRKLLYVACSRAKKNLRCVRLIEELDEVRNISNYFDNCVHVNLD